MTATATRFSAWSTWDGEQWQVRIADPGHDGPRGHTTAARLDQVAANARRHLAIQHGYEASDLTVIVVPQVPPELEHALQIALGHLTLASREIDPVITALRQAHMPGREIAAVLAEYNLQDTPERPLLIPNHDIATHGLTNRPDVIAIEWPDENDTLTICRTCVEKNRRPWKKQPHATSAAIYDTGGHHCDTCGHAIIPAAQDVGP